MCYRPESTAASPTRCHPRLLNYKLKDCTAQLLNLRMVGYNDSIPMNVMSYVPHVTYLTSDLLGTKALYEYLVGPAGRPAGGKLTPEQLAYNTNTGRTVTPPSW